MLIDSENLLARIDKCYQESAKTGLDWYSDLFTIETDVIQARWEE